MEYVAGLVILLGILIAIHEYGHFIIAKACGVRVEIFSIGFGKKLVSFRRGETLYTISLIPFGGYVKLTGQDPREQVPPELENRTLRSKPLWQRAAVVLAGPLFNAVLALLIYIGLFQFGMTQSAPVFNRVLEGSPAAEAGLQSGDRVVSIQKQGQTIRPRFYRELEATIEQSLGVPLVFQIERAGIADPISVTYTPELGQGRSSSSGAVTQVPSILGVEDNIPTALGRVIPNSWLAQRGLPANFLVQELRYTDEAQSREISFETKTFPELSSAWAQAIQYHSQVNSGRIELRGLSLEFTPDKKGLLAPVLSPEPKTHVLGWQIASEAPPLTLREAGFYSTEFLIGSVSEDTPAAKLGLQPLDLILSVNGEAPQSFLNFVARLQSISQSQNDIVVDWMRGSEKMTGTIRPELREVKDHITMTSSQRFQIGVSFLYGGTQTQTIVRGDNVFDSIALGWTYTTDLTTRMIRSFVDLFTGKISYKALGGFISIAKVAGDSFRSGIEDFMSMMGLISLNLFILNLLPIPVLDGGHLILYLVESVRRKPLSLKAIEVWSATGIFVLLGMMILVTFNDITRHFSGLFH